MPLITTPFDGTENVVVRREKLQLIVDFWFGPEAYQDAEILGGIRSLLNSLVIEDITDTERFGSWLVKLNLINDTELTDAFPSGYVGLIDNSGDFISREDGAFLIVPE